jgi:hypothetical protein
MGLQESGQLLMANTGFVSGIKVERHRSFHELGVLITIGQLLFSQFVLSIGFFELDWVGPWCNLHRRISK